MKLAELENLARDIREHVGEDSNPDVVFTDLDARGFPVYDVSPEVKPSNLWRHEDDHGNFFIPILKTSP